MLGRTTNSRGSVSGTRATAISTGRPGAPRPRTESF